MCGAAAHGEAQSVQPLPAVKGGLDFVLGAVPDPPHTQGAELPGVSDGGPNAVSAPTV